MRIYQLIKATMSPTYQNVVAEICLRLLFTVLFTISPGPQTLITIALDTLNGNTSLPWPSLNWSSLNWLWAPVVTPAQHYWQQLKPEFAILDNGQLNPRCMALAQSFYRFQSQALRIPDSIGLFGNHPPTLACQGSTMQLAILVWLCLSPIILCRASWWIKKNGWPDDWDRFDIQASVLSMFLGYWTFLTFVLLLLSKVFHGLPRGVIYDKETGNWGRENNWRRMGKL
ncbi:hypothetical protein QBC41DRAFT_114061 [Cercophora samala]|uniref:Uncharacterized protein n=1 Tax=Cercophora samala TaxID=330535 RepID=A0AA39ZDI4_9PEZI|nr:hypothetical protein QBC41DRAFT_114061 [Cercophora samala]